MNKGKLIALESFEIEANRKNIALEFKSKARSLLEIHPIYVSHMIKGRVFYLNVKRDDAKKAKEEAEKSGYTDLKIEKRALKETEKGVRDIRGYAAIYGRPPILN